MQKERIVNRVSNRSIIKLEKKNPNQLQEKRSILTLSEGRRASDIGKSCLSEYNLKHANTSGINREGKKNRDMQQSGGDGLIPLF